MLSYIEGHGWYLLDCNSSNGTFMMVHKRTDEQSQIKESARFRIFDDMEVASGEYRFKISLL